MKRKHYFFWTTTYVTGVFEIFDDIRYLKPTTKDEQNITPIELFRMQKTLIVIKNDNHHVTNTSNLYIPIS